MVCEIVHAPRKVHETNWRRLLLDCPQAGTGRVPARAAAEGLRLRALRELRTQCLHDRLAGISGVCDCPAAGQSVPGPVRELASAAPTGSSSCPRMAVRGRSKRCCGRAARSHCWATSMPGQGLLGGFPGPAGLVPQGRGPAHAGQRRPLLVAYGKRVGGPLQFELGLGGRGGSGAVAEQNWPNVKPLTQWYNASMERDRSGGPRSNTGGSIAAGKVSRRGKAGGETGRSRGGQDARKSAA